MEQVPPPPPESSGGVVPEFREQIRILQLQVRAAPAADLEGELLHRGNLPRLAVEYNPVVVSEHVACSLDVNSRLTCHSYNASIIHNTAKDP